MITTPTELIKIRQQNLLIPTKARLVLWQIFRESGIVGLYRGYTATCLRDCGYGPYFAAVGSFTFILLVKLSLTSATIQYEAMCRVFSPSTLHEDGGENNQLSWPALLLAGGTAGIGKISLNPSFFNPPYPMITPSAGWVFTFPFDVVKTRVQSTHRDLGALSTSTPFLAQADNPPVNPFRSTWSTIVHSYRTEGIKVFYRGLSPTLIR